MNLSKTELLQLHYTCLDISKHILDLYKGEIAVTLKADQSPLTAADYYSHQNITAFLQKQYPSIPILSEEMTSVIPYEQRKDWPLFWLVDPLDGTKEFIKKNGQFCICIALIKHAYPSAGLIHEPVTGVSYAAIQNQGAYKITDQGWTTLTPDPEDDTVCRVLGSASHRSEDMDAYITALTHQGKNVSLVEMGSALKFCMIAQGKADRYPRFGPTMEWDTAAGQVIVEAVGKQVINMKTKQRLQYNTSSLRNPAFYVK